MFWPDITACTIVIGVVFSFMHVLSLPSRRADAALAQYSRGPTAALAAAVQLRSIRGQLMRRARCALLGGMTLRHFA